MTFSNVMESASCPCCHDPLDPATCVRLPCLHQLCPLCLADMDDVNACCPAPVEPQLSCGTPFRKEDVYQPAPVPPKKRRVKRQRGELQLSHFESTDDLGVVELGITLADERLASMAVHAAKLIVLVDEKEAAQRQGSPSVVALRAQVATEMNADLKTVEQWRDTLLVARAHCKEIVAALNSAIDGLEVVPTDRLLSRAAASHADLLKLSVPTMLSTRSDGTGLGWRERRLHPPYQRSLLVNFQKEDSQGIMGSTSRSRDYATLLGSKPVRVISIDAFKVNEDAPEAPPTFGLLPDGTLVLLEEECIHILTPEGHSVNKILFEPLSIHGAGPIAVASGGGGVIWVMADEGIFLLSPTGQQLSHFSPIPNWGEDYFAGVPLEDGTMLLLQKYTGMFLYTHDGVLIWKGTDDLDDASKFCPSIGDFFPLVVRDKELWYVDRSLRQHAYSCDISPELSALGRFQSNLEPFMMNSLSEDRLLGMTFDAVCGVLVVLVKYANQILRLSVWTSDGGLVLNMTDFTVPVGSDQFGNFQLLHVPGSRGELYCWDPFRRRILVY